MVNKLWVACFFVFYSCGVNAQTKTIKPIITIEGMNNKAVDSVYIVVPNSPCDTVLLRLNDKLLSVQHNYASDSNARLFKVERHNTLQIICGSIRTTTINISNKSRYIYISMDEQNCELFFSDERMLWEGWTE